MTKFLVKFKEKPLAMGLTVLFLVLAGVTRFVLLDNKPIHFDESINMWFVERIWSDGFFRYDPTNYHGPLLFYVIQFVQLFTGFDYLSTRWVATFFSFLTLVILWWIPPTQQKEFRWAAVFLLISPAMGFYGRSGIHESAFVFFQVLGFLSFHFLVIKDFKKFWWFFFAGLLGMMALKETFVILVLAFIPAALVVFLAERKRTSFKKWTRELIQSFKSREVALPVLGMFLLFLGLYSGFGAHPQGLTDFFVALMPWLKTGVHGSGHEKGFLTWSLWMGQYEFAILAGFAFSLFFTLKNKWIRFYAVFTIFLWLIYSLIPYKTPWCLISILWPFGVLAGFGVQGLLEKLQGSEQKALGRGALYLVLTGLFIAEGWVAYQIVYRQPIDMEHPYVYVNSSYQLKEFVNKTRGLLNENPLLREQTIQIGTEESWPMPIVMKPFYNLSYFRISNKVEEDALIYMVDLVDKKVMEEALKSRGRTAEYAVFSLEVRQGRSAIFIYLKKNFFQNRFSWDLKEVGTL